MERQPPQSRTFNVVEMPVLLKVICRVNAIPIKIFSSAFSNWSLLIPCNTLPFRHCSFHLLNSDWVLFMFPMCLLHCLNLWNIVGINVLKSFSGDSKKKETEVYFSR